MWRSGGELKIGEIILNNEYAIVPFKAEVDLLSPDKAVALDVNEDRVVAVSSDGRVEKFDLSEAKRLHHAYFEIRREVQGKFSLKTARRIIKEKMAKRERLKVRGLLHKDFRLLKSFVDYKAKLNRSPTAYLDPRGTSKNCSGCGGVIAPKEMFCPSCGLNRHINACINLLKMWGCQPALTCLPMT